MHAGTRLGPYEITALLGAGAMGEVYQARDSRLGRDVAIKVVAAHSIDALQARERFEREARSVAGLQHPNICTIYDVGDADGRAFIVMELLHGETLQQRLRRGPIDLPAFLDIAIALADGLHAAHAAGIVHRDIKPANIFLTEHGPKILDFGLAKADLRATAPASAAETLAMLTESGRTVGTIAYMSPEQLRGEAADARSDLFSLGMVLYEMATGRSPFTGATSAAIGGAILHEEPRPPRSLRADLPDALDQLVLKALEKDRDLRYQSAADIRADLQRQRRSTGVKTGEVPVATAVTAPHRSKRMHWVGGAAVLAAVSAAGYWSYFTRSTPTLTETDTIVLGDFTNTTGDAVFDDALRQGLIVQLQQSPYLHVLPDRRVRRVLTMMGQPPDAKLTSAVALEVCQRSSSAIVIDGSIASLGSQYVLGLTATDCRSGELLDTQQSQVPGKENVLGALSDMASAFRRRAGESLAMIRTHEKPLQEATTASLEALKAYSAARRAGSGCAGNSVARARGRARSRVCSGPCQPGSVLQRDRPAAVGDSERDPRVRTTATHDRPGTILHRIRLRPRRDRRSREGIPGRHRLDPDLSSRSRRSWPARRLQRAWNRSIRGCARIVRARPGDRSRFRLCPQRGGLGQHVSGALRCGQARAPARRCPARSEHACARLLHRHAGAGRGGHGSARDANQGSPEPHLLQHAQSLAAARTGQLRRARTLAREAVDAAEGLGLRETAAVYDRRPRCGRRSRETSRRPDSARSPRWVCRTDATSRMQAASRWRSRETSLDRKRWRTISSASIHATRSSDSPTCRPCARLPRSRATSRPWPSNCCRRTFRTERAVPATAFNFFFGSLYPVYVRGQAYAASGLPQQAAAEFQKILDHPGLMMGDPAGARARLEKARSLARAGGLAAARSAYQDFLALWKNADVDVPILAQAKAEYAKLPIGSSRNRRSPTCRDDKDDSAGRVQ